MDAASFPGSLLGMSCDEQHLETELKKKGRFLNFIYRTCNKVLHNV